MVSTRTLALFTGSWLLQNITRTQNGSVIYDTTYGDRPLGLINYNTDGYMFAILQSTDAAARPTILTLPAQANQTDSEWAEIGRHSLAYAGPYNFNSSRSIDERHGEVLHGPLISSTLPAFVGSTQHRNFSFSEDGNYLNLIGNLGHGIVDDLWWMKTERNVSLS